jgi:crossover junction endodeoxyribonuclease RusA
VTVTRFELVVPGPLHTVNRERAVHWRISRGWTKTTRELAGWVGRGAPRFVWCDVEVWPEQAKGRLADVGAHLPSVKAAVDGLVDAGVLADDGPVFLRSLLLNAPVRGGRDLLRLVLVGERKPSV